MPWQCARTSSEFGREQLVEILLREEAASTGREKWRVENFTNKTNHIQLIVGRALSFLYKLEGTRRVGPLALWQWRLSFCLVTAGEVMLSCSFTFLTTKRVSQRHIKSVI